MPSARPLRTASKALSFGPFAMDAGYDPLVGSVISSPCTTVKSVYFSSVHPFFTKKSVSAVGAQPVTSTIVLPESVSVPLRTGTPSFSFVMMPEGLFSLAQEFVNSK